MRAGRLPAHEACRILVPCMEGIEAAHAAGIVHRDIKPANIFLCAAGGGEVEQAKVLDFGVAAFSNAQGGLDFTQTHSGAIIGTPFYMAPEQMRGQPIDHRADVYALGVTLYELLSGRRPFYATAYADLILQIANTTPIPVEELVPDLPAGLAAIVRRAMARDAAGRFSAMREFIDALAPLPATNTLPGALVHQSSRCGAFGGDTAGRRDDRSWTLLDHPRAAALVSFRGRPAADGCSARWDWNARLAFSTN